MAVSNVPKEEVTVAAYLLPKLRRHEVLTEDLDLAADEIERLRAFISEFIGWSECACGNLSLHAKLHLDRTL